MKLIRALQDDAIRRRREKVYDATSMAVTARLLEINPEVLTAWNFRREAIAAFERERRGAPSDATEDHEPLCGVSARAKPNVDAREVGNLADELALTERCLRKHPKSYPTWHHRKWCVARAARGEDSESEQVSSLLETELSMSKSLLDLDDRNFHGWGYRRFVVALMSARGGGSNAKRQYSVGEGVFEISTASALSELRYSEEKIERNFSNYSAWHHRAACLPRAFSVSSSVAGTRETNANEGDGAGTSGGDDEHEDASEDRNFPRPSSAFVPERVLANEYALVRQALFTEPEDQAGWMYHRWLTAQTLNNRRRAEGAEFAAEKEESSAGAEFASEADALAELCELEPECKWPVLTLARLCDLKGTDTGAAESAARFDQLKRLDPTRRGFYCDCGGRA